MNTSEQDFEATVVAALTGTLPVQPLRELRVGYAEPAIRYRERKTEHYDRTVCLDTGILFDFIYAT